MDTTNGIVSQGNCHCGSCRFELHLTEPIEAVKCDCLLCRKQG